MRPPVALLAHAVDEPGRAAFWPLAEFSPEWVAIRWALEPRGPGPLHRPAGRAHAGRGGARSRGRGGSARPRERGRGAGRRPRARLSGVRPARRARRGRRLRRPRALVGGRGRAPGRRGDGRTRFAPVRRARGGHGGAAGDVRDRRATTGILVREAYMRLQMRAAQQEFGDGVAVVCGAWHVPALREKTTVAADRALLKGLPKVKADMTWVPWTHRRLARASGYGAGIDSPGWYGHLFGAPGPARRAVADQGRRPAARRGPAWSPRRTSSRRSGWPRPSPRCAGARCPA